MARSANKLTALVRTETGKGASRRARREGKIPAVLYGHGADPQHLELPGHDFAAVLRHSGTNAVLTLDIDGKEQFALTKALAIHPIRRSITHADLLVVRRGEKVTVEVPIQVIGEIAPGDSMLDQQLVQITVEAEATNIPREINVDVEGMELGDAVHASDLKLPEGTTLQVEPDTLILHVINQQGGEPEAEETEEGAEVPESVDAEASTQDSEGE